MSKSKRPPKNFFRYFLDEFILFRHDFSFELANQPNKLAKGLGELSDESSTWWQQRQIVSHVEKVSKGWEFDISAQHAAVTSGRFGIRRKQGYTRNVRATGKIFTDKGITRLTGRISMTKWSYLYMLFMLMGASLLVLSLLQINTSSLENTGIYLFYCFVGIWLCLPITGIYRDRNHLIKLIQQAIEAVENDTQND